ncbi:MAG: hypothetical protein H6917_12635 [Novosphingobium sp.]|nr:hypothetical protein [Novosphingobium sp.]MCP5403217.1 hypothetical protein [Novosphingobium sp.]
MNVQRVILAALMAALVAACGARGEYYEKSPSAVKTSLRTATLPLHVLGNWATGKRVTHPDDETVVIAVLDKEQSELVRFVTTVVPDGEGSRVAVDVEPPQGRHAERAARAMEKSGMTMALMNSLAREHVDAAIKGRPFDMTFGANPVAKGVIAAVPGVEARIEKANRTAMEFQEAERRAKFEDEYGDDWGVQ